MDINNVSIGSQALVVSDLPPFRFSFRVKEKSGTVKCLLHRMVNLVEVDIAKRFRNKEEEEKLPIKKKCKAD